MAVRRHLIWGVGLALGAGIAAVTGGAATAAAAPQDSSAVSAQSSPAQPRAQSRAQSQAQSPGGAGRPAARAPRSAAARGPAAAPRLTPRPAAGSAATRAAGDYLLIRKSDLMAKPTSGAGWSYLKSEADAVWETPDLSKLNTKTPTQVMAAALVYARTGDQSYREKAVTALAKVPGTEIKPSEAKTAMVLPFARNVFGYVVAADLVGLPLDTRTDNGQTWGEFLVAARTKEFPGNTRWINLEKTSGDSASNWNAYALSSHLAISIALGDTAAIERDITIYRRFLGDTTSPWPAFKPTSGYTWNNNGRSWDMTATLQRGINPDKPGDARSGAIILDALRHTTLPSVRFGKLDLAGRAYTEETLDALLAINMMLKAHGSDFTDFQNQALRRAYAFLARNGGPSGYSNGRYLALAMNNLYGSTYSTAAGDSVARHLGFGGWLVTR